MLNLKYYKGEDLYSDGKVEDKILGMVREKISLGDIPVRQVTWPIYYHLSPIRQNLLNWYPFDASASLLEIGAGCGALTALFCDKVKSVTAVELSKRRASIIDARCKSFDNLEIFAGNLNDINFNRKFDYITLIGVLEYAPSFTSSDNPVEDFLRTIKKLLAPGGTILIAIENQFGLKYFAGAKEDHLGSCFSGIEGYNGINKVKTFGKYELTSMIERAGFKEPYFYYPMPDYKLPKVIYSDDFLPSTDSYFDIYSPNYDQDRYRLFNERAVFKEIIRNMQFPFFANSFLAEAKV
jgi:SAM-dependent methyltransferase